MTREGKTTEEDLKKACRRGNREDWFQKGGCPESRKVERWSANNCRNSEVNLAISVKGTIPEKKMNYCYYYCRGVELLKDAMKIDERVLERRIRKLVNIDLMQFCFVPENRTTDALFEVRRMQEGYIRLRER